MPDARAHAPATSCLPARRWTHPRAPRTPPGLSLSPVPSPPSSGSLSLPPSGARRHRSLQMQPPATPRLADASRSSASSSALSSTSETTRDTLHHRHHRRPHLRPPEIAIVVPATPVHPLPRARRHRDRCELSSVSPPSPCSISCRSHASRRTRAVAPPWYLPVVARATASRACTCHRAQQPPRRPTPPPAAPAVPCSTRAHPAELWPPPRACFRRAPAPPQPPTCSPGCGRRRATPRWSPRVQPPLVAQVRRVAAALLVAAGQNSGVVTWQRH